MKTPMRIIEGDARPFEAFWRMVDAAKSESGETEIEFFGPISEYSWWGDEITPKLFKDDLEKAKGGPVRVKVHSPGGEVFAAAAIRSILQDYPGKVTAEIIGLAASAATVVVTGADRVLMRDSAMFMIHDPSTIAWGTVDEMKKAVDVLEGVKETIVNAYQTKTGLTREMLGDLMSEETWMTAEQAKKLGFVDEIITGGKAKSGAAKNVRAAFLNCLSGYEKVPEAVSRELGYPNECRSGDGEEEEVIADEGQASSEPEADNKAVELTEEEAQLRNQVLIILGK
jgi:ATP-dependent Clp protease, protease subunit